MAIDYITIPDCDFFQPDEFKKAIRARLASAILCGSDELEQNFISVQIRRNKEKMERILQEEMSSVEMIRRAYDTPEGSPAREWADAMLKSWAAEVDG